MMHPPGIIFSERYSSPSLFLLSRAKHLGGTSCVLEVRATSEDHHHTGSSCVCLYVYVCVLCAVCCVVHRWYFFLVWIYDFIDVACFLKLRSVIHHRVSQK